MKTDVARLVLDTIRADKVARRDLLHELRDAIQEAMRTFPVRELTLKERTLLDELAEAEQYVLGQLRIISPERVILRHVED